MRIHDLCFVLALAACKTNPDPRHLPPETMQREAFGGYIVVTSRDGALVTGELLAVAADRLYVDGPDKYAPFVVARGNISTAELFEYESGDVTTWGVLGTLSTASHGFLLVFSAPLWIAATSIANAVESRHMILHYPSDGWEPLARWARYPQGPPEQLRVRAGEHRLMPPSGPLTDADADANGNGNAAK
jgi:hypothetical protein